MAHLNVSDELIEQAKVVGNHKTETAAVTAALEESMRRRKQLEIIKAFGTIDRDPEYDYKAARQRKRG